MVGRYSKSMSEHTVLRSIKLSMLQSVSKKDRSFPTNVSIAAAIRSSFRHERGGAYLSILTLNSHPINITCYSFCYRHGCLLCAYYLSAIGAIAGSYC